VGLRWLNLRLTQVTAMGFVELHKSLPEARIEGW